MNTCPRGRSTVGLSAGICHVMFYAGLSGKGKHTKTIG